MTSALESSIIKILSELGLGALGLFFMWKLFMKQLDDNRTARQLSVEEQRLEREQHKRNIERIADTLGSHIEQVCKSAAEISDKNCTAIIQAVHDQADVIVKRIDKHDEKVDTRIELAKK